MPMIYPVGITPIKGRIITHTMIIKMLMRNIVMTTRGMATPTILTVMISENTIILRVTMIMDIPTTAMNIPLPNTNTGRLMTIISTIHQRLTLKIKGPAGVWLPYWD